MAVSYLKKRTKKEKEAKLERQGVVSRFVNVAIFACLSILISVHPVVDMMAQTWVTALAFSLLLGCFLLACHLVGKPPQLTQLLSGGAAPDLGMDGLALPSVERRRP